jgi:hypothetical protein
MPDWKWRGFVEEAGKTLKDATAAGKLSDDQLAFLKDGFDDARDRMTTLATSVGTAGSFVLVLVALLIGFSTKTDEQSDQLIKATNTLTQRLSGCTEKSTSDTCNDAQIEQARDEVSRAQVRLNRLGRLNRAQTITGALVVTGFLLGLAALLTNPVAGPSAAGTDTDSIAAWKRALDRLKTKRWWIIASLCAQLGAIASIVYVGLNVFSS